ncbi:MAG: phage tail sheath family protein [Flavobacteriales bacterium]|nr:phage tail sheath family protein [Flavobacteriales bacterium]MCB9448594.1 phage tail sheath family protein [Flavobacteriales bacterium]
MAFPKTPGVYIEEVSTLPPSVAAVETAIPAFIGCTEVADKNGVAGALDRVPTRITNMLEYVQYFGGPFSEDAAITVTIEDDMDGGAEVVNRTITATVGTASAFKMYYALQHFFANGGGPCYIVSVGDYSGSTVNVAKSKLMNGLTDIEKIDEPTLYVFPDHSTVANYKDVYDAALAQCEKLKDRFVIMDYKSETGDPFADGTAFRNSGISSDNLKYGAVYYPYLKTTLSYGYDESLLTVAHNEVNPANTGALDGDTVAAIKASNPDVYRAIIAKLAALQVTLPPSPAMAGIYARVDNDRGVWKAPANVGVFAVVGPTIKITKEQQESLNVDATSGKSVNALRAFPGKGTLVWGARTLAGNDNEWRYVPVRRLFIFVEESVKKATEFSVFEPNDANTWLRVKTMIENFLSKLWRDGALAGAKPDQAYFVKVGLGVTMSAQDILEGRMNIEIGLAAVRPAEFIVLKFSHKLQQS